MADLPRSTTRRAAWPGPLAAATASATIAVYAAASWWHGHSVDHFTVLNDFWGNAFAADHWQWNARRLWNGFFPPGYPFILTVLPGARMLESAFNFNILSGTALLLAVSLTVRHWAAAWVGVVAMVLVAVHPLMVTQTLTTGPDAPFVLLAALGGLLLFNAVALSVPNAVMAVLAGCALGGAGWLRYHGFPWAAALLCAVLLVGGLRRVRYVLLAALPITIAGCALILMGLEAGDLQSLQRDQAFNTLTRLVEPPNWFHLPRPEELPTSIGAAIARNPTAFWKNYIAFSTPHLWLFVAPIAAVVFGGGGGGGGRAFGAYVLVASTLFVPFVDLGASPRGVACAVPLILTSAASAMAGARRRITRTYVRHASTAVAAAVVFAFCWSQWLPETRAYLDAVRFRHGTSRALETALRQDRVRFAMQVFSTTDLYFLGSSGWEVAAYHPRIVGGWPTVDLPGYNETYPEPSTDTLDSFLDDCLGFGVTHLALGAASSMVFSELGQLYDGRLMSSRLHEIPSVPGVRLFRISS